MVKALYTRSDHRNPAGAHLSFSSVPRGEILCIRLVWFATRDKFAFTSIEERKKGV